MREGREGEVGWKNGRHLFGHPGRVVGGSGMSPLLRDCCGGGGGLSKKGKRQKKLAEESVENQQTICTCPWIGKEEAPVFVRGEEKYGLWCGSVALQGVGLNAIVIERSRNQDE